MYPKIKKSKDKFLFDGRLSEEELALFSDCLNKRIQVLSLESLQLKLEPNLWIKGFGRCCFRFRKDNTSTVSICLKSLFDEVNGPIVDQGSLFIQRIVTDRKGLKNSMLIPPHQIDKSFVAHIDYPTSSPVTKISFYGNHEVANIKDIDADVDLEGLLVYGFKDYPIIECDSIEFFVFEHKDDTRSIISLENGGFWYNLNMELSIEDLIEDSYVKINGYKKNIILQHEIT